MSREIKLITPQRAFDALHDAANGRKIMVPVDRDHLAKLLCDHTRLISACKVSGIKVIEPPARKRPELKSP